MKRKKATPKEKGFELEPDTTHFLNVDLEIESREPLDALVAAFGKRVSVHRVGLFGPRKYGAYVSRVTYGQPADKLTRALCALVARLPKPARALWDRARSRRFDIGIEAGHAPPSHAVQLEARTIALVASVGGSIVVTTYAPHEPRKR